MSANVDSYFTRFICVRLEFTEIDDGGRPVGACNGFCAFARSARREEKTLRLATVEAGCYVCEGHIEQSVKGQRDA